MLLVNFSQVSKDFSGNPVFDEIDLEILEGERIGLVGENGSGKSTLLELVAGLDSPTEGNITRRRNLTIGYLLQEADPAQSGKSIYEAVAEVSPEVVLVSSRLRELEACMSDPAVTSDAGEMEKVLDAYGKAQERFESLGGYTLEHKVEEVLGGLGFRPEQYGQKVGTLSGGEKKLVSLACILLQTPDLLLLDEPDNHLDLQAKAWLERFIRDYSGTVMIISHDRFLLDRVVKKIYQLEDGKIEVYAGNYSFYARERQQRLLKRHELYNLQQDEIKRLEVVHRNLVSWAKQNPKFAPRAESMRKRVERARREATERPVMTREKIKVNFDSDRSGKKVLEAKEVSKSIGERLLFAPFNLTVLYGERIGIVGPNGSGKTTLLKVLMEEIASDTGSVKLGASVVSGYYEQEQQSLPAKMTLLDYIRYLKPVTEQHALGILRSLLFSFDDAYNKIGNLSGGEKSRLQIARLMLTDANLLVLDEPTNNLDIASIEVLEESLGQFEGTIVTVSHDRYFLDKIVTKTVAIGENGRMASYAGNFSYYLEKSSQSL